MASRVGLIMRTAAARERNDAAIQHLFEQEDFGSLQPAPPQDRDPEVAAMLREEWLADVMEALAFGPPALEEEQGGEGSGSDLEAEELAGEATDEPREEVPNDQPLVGTEGEVVDLDEPDGEPDGTEDPQEPTEAADLDALMAMSLADLKDHAVDQGADAQAVEKARSRKDVISIMYPEPEGEG